MRKPGMCRPLLVTRLTELNEQLVTIAKLQKMEDECNRNPVVHSKICNCTHHTMCTGENKKKDPCNVNTCKAKKKCNCACKSNRNKVNISEKQIKEIREIASDKQIYNIEKIDSNEDKIHIKSKDECIHIINNVENISNEIRLEDSDKRKKCKEIGECMMTNECLGRIKKDLCNEKKQKEDLEEKQCSIKCKDAECQVPYLKNALKEIEEQLAQARKETNAAIADRNKLLQTISILKEEIHDINNKNTSLNCQCQDLKCKLQTVSENETKNCTVVQDEINHLKCISKRKEEILYAEINELKGLITELTNVTKIQERRICELTNVCKKQQCSLHKKNKLLMEKGSQIAEVQSLLNSYNCKCTEMQNDIKDLQSSLNRESDVCNHLKEELERYKDDYNCMLNIKTKIIEEQNETIRKQKRLLQESEKMAQQAASEFEEIRNEFVREKETCESLRFALITAEDQINQRNNTNCVNCQNLMMELKILDQQKQNASAAAKEALQKLCNSVQCYQRQLVCEKQKCKFLTSQLKEKQEEVEYIKEEIAHRKKLVIRRTSDFLS